MNRIQLACYGLMASAFLLAGALFVQIQERWTSPAWAELAVNKGSVTLMTARTRPDEEALFVLDNYTQKLLVYRVDLGHKDLELSGAYELPTLFRQAGATAEVGGGPGGGASGGAGGAGGSGGGSRTR